MISVTFFSRLSLTAPLKFLRSTLSCCPLLARYLSVTCSIIQRTNNGPISDKYRTDIEQKQGLLPCIIGATSRLHLAIYVKFYTSSLPNGDRASFASRKCIFPKGMPMMVMQKMRPYKICVNQIQMPPTMNHSTFMNMLRQPG